MPKLDYVIMNPPYGTNLYLKILERIIEFPVDKIGAIFPATWLIKIFAKGIGDKNASWYNEIKDKIEHHLKSIYLDKEKLWYLFNANGNQILGIYQIDFTRNFEFTNVNSYILGNYKLKSVYDINLISWRDGNKKMIDNIIEKYRKSDYPVYVKRFIAKTDKLPEDMSDKYLLRNASCVFKKNANEKGIISLSYFNTIRGIDKILIHSTLMIGVYHHRDLNFYKQRMKKTHKSIQNKIKNDEIKSNNEYIWLYEDECMAYKKFLLESNVQVFIGYVLCSQLLNINRVFNIIKIVNDDKYIEKMGFSQEELDFIDECCSKLYNYDSKLFFRTLEYYKNIGKWNYVEDNYPEIINMLKENDKLEYYTHENR